MPAPSPGAAATADPMAGVERVFIDGSNLLFALGRGPVRERGAALTDGPPVPAGAVIGRLRAAFPPSVSVELVFDGRATGGVAGRLATGLRVSYSGRETADRLIDEGVLAQLHADGPAGTWGILVVTDDRGLRNLVQSKGARVAGTAWLARRIGQAFEDRPQRGGPARGRQAVPGPRAGTTIGHRRAPRTPNAQDRD
ncbi:MAG: NYN domain-containing protein [Chloroflexota bacterium]